MHSCYAYAMRIHIITDSGCSSSTIISQSVYLRYYNLLTLAFQSHELWGFIELMGRRTTLRLVLFRYLSGLQLVGIKEVSVCVCALVGACVCVYVCTRKCVCITCAYMCVRVCVWFANASVHDCRGLF